MIVVNARFLTQKITGVQRFAIEISLELKKILKENVLFISPCNIEQKEYAKILGVTVVGKHKGHVWEQWDLPLYLNEIGKPLLLNLANTAPLIYKNKISTIHDVAFEIYPQTFNKTFLYVYRFLMPRIIRSSKRIVTVSESSKREICDIYQVDKEKVFVVYNAVSDKFKHIENERLKSEKYFLAVSSLNYRKNFIAVLKAFELYSKTHEEEHLYIIGDIRNANFKGIDISQFMHNPRVKFLGRVSDNELIAYYSNAIGFIYPSIYEGFGIPPLEAQACSCPILLSDIPSLKEVFSDSALYCNPYDINDIAEKMHELLDKTETYIKRGTKNVNRFSWNASAQLLCNQLLKS